MAFQKAAVQLGGLFLHPLQHSHAFTGYPQRFCQGITGSSRCRCLNRRLNWCSRCATGWLSNANRLWCNCWPLGLGLDIVGAAEGNHQQRFFGRYCRCLIILIPQLKVKLKAKHAQLRKAASQVNQSVTLAIGAVQGNAAVLTVTKDRLDQTRQAGTRANLNKTADTGCVHRFNLGNKLNRAGQLIGQQLFGCCCVSRVGGGIAVSIDRHGRAAQLDISQTSQKRYCGISHQGAVEGSCNRQLFTGELTALTGSFCQFDLVGCTGQDRLGRGIAVGNHQVDLFLSQHLLNCCQGG